MYINIYTYIMYFGALRSNHRQCRLQCIVQQLQYSLGWQIVQYSDVKVLVLVSGGCSLPLAVTHLSNACDMCLCTHPYQYSCKNVKLNNPNGHSSHVPLARDHHGQCWGVLRWSTSIRQGSSKQAKLSGEGCGSCHVQSNGFACARSWRVDG